MSMLALVSAEIAAVPMYAQPHRAGSVTQVLFLLKRSAAEFLKSNRNVGK